jgi:2-polyprenyl-3-methyl-5-hydroxy-6-metoxy-1,4-benzoquinol methylase
MTTTFDDAYRRLEPVFGLEPDPVLARLVMNQQLHGRALDLGAGDGRNSIFLAAHGFTVEAVDLSPAAVDKLKQLAGRRKLHIHAEVCDLCEAGTITGTHDIIVADTVLCHLPARETARLAQEISTSLQPGGWLYVAAFSDDDPRESEFAPLVETYFTVETLCNVFSDLRHKRCDQVHVVDNRHGCRHRHVLVRLIAQKEGR